MGGWTRIAAAGAPRRCWIHALSGAFVDAASPAFSAALILQPRLRYATYWLFWLKSSCKRRGSARCRCAALAICGFFSFLFLFLPFYPPPATAHMRTAAAPAPTLPPRRSHTTMPFFLTPAVAPIINDTATAGCTHYLSSTSCPNICSSVAGFFACAAGYTLRFLLSRVGTAWVASSSV